MDANKLKVLIVEDEFFIALGAEEQVRSLGHTVGGTAVSAEQAIQIAGAEARYVFNASGQTIDLEGLLCLFDAEGPCANAVKDAQRTKTHGGTLRTLSVVWGTNALPGRTADVARWYRALLERAGVATSDGA